MVTKVRAMCIGGGSSFEVGGQEWGLGRYPTPGAKPSVGFEPPEADNTFCENMLFCHRFKNDIAIFAFIAYIVRCEWKKNQFGCRKLVGQATVLIGPLGTNCHKKWAGDCPMGSASNS